MSWDTLDQENYVKIVNLDKIDPNLHEVIIILYSKFKSDAQLLRSNSFKVLGKTLDNVSELAIGMKYIIDAIEAAEEAKSKRSGVMSRIIAIASSLSMFTVFIVFIFALFKTDNETSKLVIELVKSIIGIL